MWAPHHFLPLFLVATGGGGQQTAAHRLLFYQVGAEQIPTCRAGEKVACGLSSVGAAAPPCESVICGRSTTAVERMVRPVARRSVSLASPLSLSAPCGSGWAAISHLHAASHPWCLRRGALLSHLASISPVASSFEILSRRRGSPSSSSSSSPSSLRVQLSSGPPPFLHPLVPGVVAPPAFLTSTSSRPAPSLGTHLDSVERRSATDHSLIAKTGSGKKGAAHIARRTNSCIRRRWFGRAKGARLH